ncbi:hypothetical protein [Deinococcus planocerae]|uniref:hypothetical protein n=1 Tax=Deinococcus planocerae TaxID=1737569 RepID=UPI0015E11FC0|nr:hypothetical protein [Deinococcus planocerae]
MKVWMVGLVVGALGGGFVAGRLSAPAPFPLAVAGTSPTLRPLPVQAQVQGDPREVIPLVPGPGDEPGRGQPGQQPGPQQPGQQPGQGQEQCVLLFKDGQMYRLQPGQPGPGQQPGQQPGQPQPGGDGRGNGPGGDNELFPLEPFSPAPGQGPSQPGEPALPDLNRRT